MPAKRQSSKKKKKNGGGCLYVKLLPGGAFEKAEQSVRHMHMQTHGQVRDYSSSDTLVI